jgi:hypothetical protein
MFLLAGKKNASYTYFIYIGRKTYMLMPARQAGLGQRFVADVAQ